VPLTTAAHPANPTVAEITNDSNKKVRHACALELFLKTDWDVFMFPFFPRLNLVSTTERNYWPTGAIWGKGGDNLKSCTDGQRAYHRSGTKTKCYVSLLLSYT
jgi:hypothetical protein